MIDATSMAETFVVNCWLAALVAIGAIVLLLLIAQALITRATPADPNAGLVGSCRAIPMATKLESQSHRCG